MTVQQLQQHSSRLGETGYQLMMLQPDLGRVQQLLQGRLRNEDIGAMKLVALVVALTAAGPQACENMFCIMTGHDHVIDCHTTYVTRWMVANFIWLCLFNKPRLKLFFHNIMRHGEPRYQLVV